MRLANTVRGTIAVLTICMLAALLTGGCSGKRHADRTHDDPSREQILVNNSKTALEQLAKADDVPPFRSYLRKAKGVVIFPSLYKGSYFIGVEGGTGVMLARNTDGSWTPPSFITMADLSFGFQAGGQITTCMLILMEQEYVEDALQSGLTLNADISAAIGPTGHSGQIDYGTHTKGIVYVAFTRGIAFSMALEGGTIAINHDRNLSYYGMGVTPAEIVSGKVDNSGSFELRDTLASLAAETKESGIE
ncbi:lipid-binding SYLF domain-containing protein [Desulfovibrio mangrovi]|uniref:lipid-binding SYLF domain-containing protein n=1 Tax=Desulfovibrio mangrovi TaxID=2976983 RepID=UPI002246604E|nr:lipid-binding SYLF domain-containing protein [Desulfovibrio mangrovi]UZP67212.1 lipid-binding SYLF domain-containing protein [Desulfovibrio mangrovi]